MNHLMDWQGDLVFCLIIVRISGFLKIRIEWWLVPIQFQFQIQVPLLAYLLSIGLVFSSFIKNEERKRGYDKGRLLLPASLLISLALLISLLPSPTQDHTHISLLPEILPHH